MAQWEFYGRQAESANLAAHLQIDPARHPPAERFFRAVGIGGRRGVGKNTLLDHVVQQHGWNDRLLVVTLPAEIDNVQKPVAFMKAMMNALQMSGMRPLLDDMQDLVTDEEWGLGQIIEHLVHKDIIVCLDEVHAILDTVVPTVLARIIGKLGSCTIPMDERARGQLVLMGSHQQKFGQLQKGKAALAGHFRTVHLHPWSLGTVMDIAQKHGWDRRPERFHTLWTAYGGMPREWERFATSDDTPESLRHWDEPSADEDSNYADDQDWRQLLVQHESHVLATEQQQRWNNKAYVELSRPVRDAIIWMGQNKKPGQVIPGKDIVGGIIREARTNEVELDPPLFLGDLNDQLEALENDTDIVRQRHHFIGRITGSSRPCWSLNDNTTLFQLAIRPDLFPPRYRPATTPPLDNEQAVSALEDLEGTSMERLAVAWLQGHPHVLDAYAGAEPAGPKGQTQSDIDVLVRVTQYPKRRSPQDLLVLGNAKRNSSEHDYQAFQRAVECFMARGRLPKKDPEYSPEIARICQLPYTLVFVSPTFRAADRERIQVAGHLALDSADMVAERRNGWPLLHEHLERARTAGPAQETGMAPPAPPKPRQTEVNRQVEEPQPPDKKDAEPQP